MFCTNCGRQNKDDGLFCIYCGKPLQKAPGTSEAPGGPGSLFAENPAAQSQPANPSPKADEKGKKSRKGRAGLIIAISAVGLLLAAVILTVFLWLIPFLNNRSGDRPEETTAAEETTEEEELSIVGFWANEDIPGAVKFKSNGSVILYSKDDNNTTGTFEYDEEEEEGVLFLDDGEVKFYVSGDKLDIKGASEFRFYRVEDEDFDVQEFMEENRSSDMTTPAEVSDATTIGVAMPTQSLQRWYQDGENLKTQLEAAGYAVDLQYANNDVATQISQIEDMIENGCSVLVIAAIDGSSLSTVLAEAAEENIPVVAFDRLIYYSETVTYYATFDNYMVGTIQGEYVVEALQLDTAEGPFNIEFFGGAPDDWNAPSFYQGAYDVLKPYMDSGKLVVVSDQIAFEAVATTSWKTENAQARMDTLLTNFYSDGTKLDAVVCANDSTALGVEIALEKAGYEAGENWPVITGQDCDLPNMLNMLAGKQSMSVFKDTRTLVDMTVEMVTAIVNKTEVPINNIQDYDNGCKLVPTFLCDPVYADVTNYKQLLIDSGYYTADELSG